MSKVKYVIVHCSAGEFGTARTIDLDHRTSRGWRCIGYQYVILNGKPFNAKYVPYLDGQLETGREFDGDNVIEFGEVGAHTVGYNSDSVGVCLIGLKVFTDKQLLRMYDIINDFRRRFELPLENVKGHYETGANKTCPNMPMDDVRLFLDGRESLEELKTRIAEHINKIYAVK